MYVTSFMVRGSIHRKAHGYTFAAATAPSFRDRYFFCGNYPDVPIASGGLVRAPGACHSPSCSSGQPRSAGKKGTLGIASLYIVFIAESVVGGVAPESPPMCSVVSSWGPAVRTQVSRV